MGLNRLYSSGLLSEAAKVFGLRSRRLKLYLDQNLTQGMKSWKLTYWSYGPQADIELWSKTQPTIKRKQVTV